MYEKLGKFTGGLDASSKHIELVKHAQTTQSTTATTHEGDGELTVICEGITLHPLELKRVGRPHATPPHLYVMAPAYRLPVHRYSQDWW